MSKKLVLIDGNSIAYRAFFALPLLNNDKGVQDRHKKVVDEGREFRYYWYPLNQKGNQSDGLLIMSTEVDEFEEGNQQIWLVLTISLVLALVLIIILGSRITVRYTFHRGYLPSTDPYTSC